MNLTNAFRNEELYKTSIYNKEMNFKKIIGLNFEKISSKLGPFQMENNECELELEEGIEEQFYINAKNNSFKMILNKEKRIQVIFLYPNKNGLFPIEQYTVEMGRDAIRKIHGKPNREGDPKENFIIGSNGGFDRYDKEIVYHFEYCDKTQTTLKMITLMSHEIAP